MTQVQNDNDVTYIRLTAKVVIDFDQKNYEVWRGEGMGVWWGRGEGGGFEVGIKDEEGVMGVFI